MFSYIAIFFFIGVACSSKTLRVDVKMNPEDALLKREGRSIMEVDVITPLRLTSDLKSSVASGHFRRRRSTEEDTEDFSNPTYLIPAFGEKLRVRLTPDDDLIAPAFTTTFTWDNNTVGNMEPSRHSSLRRCFYKGHVIGKPNSQVALSICDALTGSIYTDEVHYFISPVDSSSKEHRIQRRNAGSGKTSEHDASCGVREKRNTKKYEETFIQHPLEKLARSVADNAARNKRSAVSSSAEQNIVEFEMQNENEIVKSRAKRDFASHQHYIETMVVADASMAREHGADLEHYILSIMMIANRVFSHPSLGSAIALSVVKILIIENESDGPRVSSNAQLTLHDFCLWQKALNTPDDSDPAHFDLAILLTKRDICGDSCDTLGMAEVGTMCSSRLSCAIVEDDGLSSSYTVAHEVGHVLNMFHDDNRLCRANFGNVDPESHVMSSTMGRVDSEQPWSICSKQAVIDFLQDGRGDCLRDRPLQPKVYPRDLPGVMYDINAQCEMSFGPGAVECPYMKECGKLWCKLPTGTRPNQCHTRSFPRADGSPCAISMHCMQGKCIPKTPQKMPINGRWGAWSAYGSCSRSCGGGIRESSRQCNSPSPRYGGKFCIGSRQQFESCNVQACPSINGKQPRDFRSEQCAVYDGQRFPLHGIREASTWMPKYAGTHERDRCKLICQSVQTGAYITLADRVIDGTRCGPDTTDVCVHGQCQPAGCDGVLGSKARYNKCGVCNGDSSRCKRVRGKYNKRIYGYNDVVSFPIGAASIKVTQKGVNRKIHDGNYLALQDAQGHYILNGALTLSTIKKDIEINGTVIQYSGVGVPIETIEAAMPLKQKITLQVLSLGLSGSKILSPNIRYHYYIQKKPRIHSRRGKTSRTKPDRSTLVVNRMMARPQKSHKREDRWVAGRWRKCKVYKNKKCGPGMKKRPVTCRNGKRHAKGCDAALKPFHRLPCIVSECPTSPPSTRSHPTTRRNSYAPTIVNRHHYSSQNEPIWVAGRWGMCSKSCGVGIKRRIVSCKTRDGRMLAKSQCNHSRRPRDTHRCNLRHCETN